MSNQIDLYNSTYGNFEARVLAKIRQDAFGEDIGQNSWITTDEYNTFFSWLNLSSGDHLLEVASGSGGPALGRLPLWQRYRSDSPGRPFSERRIERVGECRLVVRKNEAGLHRGHDVLEYGEIPRLK